MAKGFIHEMVEPLRRTEKYDEKTLLQKVRSEALGHWPDTSSVEVDVTDGTVRIRGSLDNEADRERLIETIKEVEGVDGVDDQITVGV